jgi:hypothetical protein
LDTDNGSRSLPIEKYLTLIKMTSLPKKLAVSNQLCLRDCNEIAVVEKGANLSYSNLTIQTTDADEDDAPVMVMIQTTDIDEDDATVVV